MPKAIYKGDRDNPGDYDNFTLNMEYDVLISPNEPDNGLIDVYDDMCELVQHPSIDFDFID